MRKGISPVIATVIIVAVAIAISIAVAGWLFGLWGGLASGTAQIQVSTVNVYDDGTVELYIVNSGSGSDTLLKVEISNGEKTVVVNDTNGDPLTQDIEANFAGWIQGSTDLSLTAGQSVTVTLYFEKSGTVTVPVTVKA